MTNTFRETTIDEYLRDRLMPAEGVIPQISGIEMFGQSIPAGVVGGDLFEYINFPQRYDLDERIARAQNRAAWYLKPLTPGAPIRDCIDDHVEWLKATPGYRPEMEHEYRFAKSSEQARVADDLVDLYSTAGVLVVDAQGHDIISAKIASTVHDTFHALVLTELDRFGKTTPELFEALNLRLAQSLTARNALGATDKEHAREIATMLYGEVRPGGHFRFANFGHPPPLVFSAKSARLLPVNQSHIAQFLALGLQLPADHPDRKKYFSLNLRQKEFRSSDVSEIMLMDPGDILILYTDGVYPGYGERAHGELELVLRQHKDESAKDICAALMDHALREDELLRQCGDEALIDDKTVLIVKRTV